MCLSCCAHRNILKNLVWSTETRLGQAAPLVVAMEAILAACPPVAEVEAVAEGPCEGPWLLVMPRGSLSFQASPRGLPVPVGCPVLSCPCLFSPGGLSCPVLSCSCVFSPGGPSLSVFVLRGLQSAHPPSPVELLRRGTRLPGGGSYVRVLLCVICSCLLCPYLVCFLSLFHVIMS